MPLNPTVADMVSRITRFGTAEMCISQSFNLELESCHIDSQPCRCRKGRQQKSCGGHFRDESQTEEGEAMRKDDEFNYVSAWEYTGTPSEANLHKEELIFENIELKQRSYK